MPKGMTLDDAVKRTQEFVRVHRLGRRYSDILAVDFVVRELARLLDALDGYTVVAVGDLNLHCRGPKACRVVWTDEDGETWGHMVDDGTTIAVLKEAVRHSSDGGGKEAGACHG